MACNVVYMMLWYPDFSYPSGVYAYFWLAQDTTGNVRILRIEETNGLASFTYKPSASLLFIPANPKVGNKMLDFGSNVNALIGTKSSKVSQLQDEIPAKRYGYGAYSDTRGVKQTIDWGDLD